jgi:di/tricarboxylate transporter
MTPQITLTLAIVIAAVILFATEKLRVDVIALLVMLVVTLTGLVSPEEAFAGFANPAVITVWAVYIVSGALFITGVADVLGMRIIRLAGHSEPRLIALIMLACGTMSAFMNNIGATAVLLPAVVGISRQSGIPLSRLLIPLAFSSLLGGNMTLIGTPPNVLAASMMAERGLPTFSFFDFMPMGIIVFGVGIIYMVLAGRFLIPVRVGAADPHASFKLQEYISEVRIMPGSPLTGQNLFESRLGADYDLTVLFIIHEDHAKITPHRNTVLQENDLLLVEGNLEDLLRVQQELMLISEAERKLSIEDLATDDFAIIEATLAPRSSISGRSLRDIEFRDRYGFTALAIRRHGEVITRRLRDERLQFGDTLLLKGPKDRLAGLRQSNEFLLLEPVHLETRRRNKALPALGILALVLLLTTFGGLNVALSMVIGATLMVLAGCLTMDEAYQSIEWRSVFLIAGMLSLGIAMESTGTAQYLAELIVNWLGPFGPLAVLAGIYVLASLITEPMSNAAAAVLIVPIAIDIALSLGVDHRPFVLATVIAASTSFLTPVGHQANVLVFSPGGYRFTDFTRVGFPLNIFIFLATMLALPRLWPF